MAWHAAGGSATEAHSREVIIPRTDAVPRHIGAARTAREDTLGVSGLLRCACDEGVGASLPYLIARWASSQVANNVELPE